MTRKTTFSLNTCITFNLSISFCFREGRYDAVCKAETKVQRAWKQKSLDEKKLRFVMKRSSIPTQLSTSTYVNHGVLTNHKAAAASSTTATPQPKSDSKGFLDSRKKIPSLRAQQQQQRLYVDDFADFDCLLEEDEKEVNEGTAGTGKGTTYKDSECQTGEELVQAMFLQLRRRRFQSSSGSNTPSPHRPVKGFGGGLKEVTFNTHVVPVHVDSSWSQANERSQVPDQLPLSRNFNDDSYLRTGETGEAAVSVEAQRRLSDLSSLSYIDGTSPPGTPAPDLPPRRSSDISDVSSHRGYQNIYHRPPTPRTPRKLLIQNNHNDITADNNSLPQSLPRDSLPSPHLLYVQSGAASRSIQASSSSISLSSLTSEGSRKSGGRGRGSDRSEGEEEEEEESPERGSVKDNGVMEFQQYLHDHGLNLDMSSVQTSDL